MEERVKLTIDGKPVEVPAGTLVINAAKSVGIEIPAFCYYDGLALQAACRMCLVEVEKAPKLLTACTLVAQDGMVVRTDAPAVAQARKAMLEFLLTNHPLDCPVCDKGGECELQDMVFRYGAGESRFLEQKVHTPEKQFSPLIYFDAPRCILCYRCVRICDEGLGVKALGVVHRGVSTEIGPNRGDHLECDECGMCIDICPVGALTSDRYRYKTRPWEMQHVGTICAHCSNGCKTTLGVRNDAIIRANNRDRSGINGEFLCIKGRFGFDFVEHPERLRTPLVRQDGELRPASWIEAIAQVARRLEEIRARGGLIGVIGSNRTTNEENYYLQKFARQVLGTNHIDHHRTGDVAALVEAVAGRPEALAKTADLYETPSAVILGADLAQQHPLLAFQLRANWRHHGLRLYAVTPGPVREDSYAVRSVRCRAGEEPAALETLAGELAREKRLVVLFGDSVKGEGVHRLVAFFDGLGVPVQYVCLVDYANSRGASDMGLLPDRLPGYRPVAEAGLKPGMTLPEMLAAPDLAALWVVGANPLRHAGLASREAFVVVQDLFLTETARRADVVLPAASAYEKTGTFTNVCGEVQQLRKALNFAGAKTDLDIFGLLARALRADIGPARPEQVLEEIRATVPGYNVALPILVTGGAAPTLPPAVRAGLPWRPELIRSARDTLFTSGTLGRYSRALNSVTEAPGELYRG